MARFLAKPEAGGEGPGAAQGEVGRGVRRGALASGREGGREAMCPCHLCAEGPSERGSDSPPSPLSGPGRDGSAGAQHSSTERALRVVTPWPGHK